MKPLYSVRDRVCVHAQQDAKIEIEDGIIKQRFDKNIIKKVWNIELLVWRTIRVVIYFDQYGQIDEDINI